MSKWKKYGYYWVKFKRDNRWVVAQWADNTWYVIASNAMFDDEDQEVIGDLISEPQDDERTA